MIPYQIAKFLPILLMQTYPFAIVKRTHMIDPKFFWRFTHQWKTNAQFNTIIYSCIKQFVNYDIQCTTRQITPSDQYLEGHLYASTNYINEATNILHGFLSNLFLFINHSFNSFKVLDKRDGNLGTSIRQWCYSPCGK